MERPDLESEFRAEVAERLGSSRFGLWFGDGVRLSLDPERESLEVGVPNLFFRDWIRNHFEGNLTEAARKVMGGRPTVSFLIDEEVEKPSTPTVAVDAPEASSRPAPSAGIPRSAAVQNRLAASTRQEPEPTPTSTSVSSRPSRKFEDYVVGPCNRLAQAAALELATSVNLAFNPLVIQGGVGLGKTHLIEAIGSVLRSRRPGTRVLQLTAESFTNGFLDAMRRGSLHAFRANFRGAGALLVDDVHFLASKRATMIEFLHTFNALASEGAPIVLASDQHPRRIPKLTDELATRFLGGMVVRLDKPDLATRKAILKTKALARGVDVPDSVISFVAEHLRASIRELEGALHSLIAHATLSGKRLDLALAKAALRDTIRHTARSLGLKDVESAVCELFQVEADELKAEGKARTIAYPRMIAMYLARKHVGAPYSEIGRYFGGRNHSTVISAEKKIAARLVEEGRIPFLSGFESTSEILASLERSLGA